MDTCTECFLVTKWIMAMTFFFIFSLEECKEDKKRKKKEKKKADVVNENPKHLMNDQEDSYY